MASIARLLFGVLCVFSLAVPARAQVIINEIHYHPLSENSREEFIELLNVSSNTVNLSSWSVNGGVDFLFPTNASILPGRYLVLAAHRPTFMALHPGVTNVIGDFVVMRVTNILGRNLTNWLNVLGNGRNSLNLNDHLGQRIDSVDYADEGDWALRRRGLLDSNHRGWTWWSEHDGGGKSLELINPALPNEHGQNWGASLVPGGTPGQANSIHSNNIAPLILETRHFPVVPVPGQSVFVIARLRDEQPNGVSAALFYRDTTGTAPPPFASLTMFDDGAHGDGVAADGIFGAIIPPHPNNTVIEFYVSANDLPGNTRTWPAAVLPGLDQVGAPEQLANALYQVDNNPANQFGGVASLQPVYKVIMSEAERAELASIPQSGDRNTDAQMNATFISADGAETLVRYLCGARNRGHGSRSANPPNYRINFRSDEPWKDVVGLNLNSRQVHIQHLGSILAARAGLAGTQSRAVQLRVNNVNRATSGSPMFGSYAANEAYGGDWAERQLPSDPGGNLYKAVRDLAPAPYPAFDYRGEDPAEYARTYIKESNVSENDYQDVIGLSAVMATNGIVPFTTENVRAVIHVEQWLRHMALMSLLGNNESGLNTGNNDDYYEYRGVHDPRFILLHHDLDQILGQGGSLGENADIFRATCCPISGDSQGTAAMMARFMNWPDFQPLYYRILQDLLDTTFSATNFNAVVDQVLGSYAPGPINAIKTWMNGRRNYVQSVITGNVPPRAPLATISGEPRSPTPIRNATLTVGGNDITHYRWRLNSGSYSAETPVATPIQLSLLPHGGSNTIYVTGRNSASVWQSSNAPTPSRSWVVNTSWPGVRINEVLARNDTAHSHSNAFPDLVELYNEGTSTVALGGMRLTDDPADPNKFSFPPNTSLAPGAYLQLYASNPSHTGDFHLGFALDQEGDGVYLFNSTANGGALLDSVPFGLQLADLSIGRIGQSGRFSLTQPTPAAANILQPLADNRTVKINEWLASPGTGFADEFFELFNPGSLPVDLSGHFLTDNPIGAPSLHGIPDLTFLGAGGYTLFTADGETGAGHVNFRLAGEQGEIALVTSGGAVLDCVNYGPQRSGVAQGRCPNGAGSIRDLVLPSPAGPNLCPVTPPPPPTVRAIGFTNRWRYEQSGANLGTAWKETDYDDSLWLSGPGLLAAPRNGGSLPEPIGTLLTVSNTKTTFYFRTTFTFPTNAGIIVAQLHHIIDDGAVFHVNGRELFRYNLPEGVPILNNTLAAQNVLDATYAGPINISPTNFVAGTNVLAVEVHQAASSSADITFGVLLEGIGIDPPGSGGVRLNEILADNASLADVNGATPDWVELHNSSDTAVDLSDMSLSDSAIEPRKWVFPPGSFILARGYFAVRFSDSLPASATNTGFGLRSSGETLFLFDSTNRMGGLLDFLTFGLQTPDFSIGLVSNAWTLTLPTIGSANLAATLGDPFGLHVNEWMASPAAGDDWFEIYNPGDQPVALGGLHLSDALNNPTNHQIVALSFIGAGSNAWQRFEADNNAAAGADHVGFALSASGEELGIFTADGLLINGTNFASQAPGVSEGRLPDGAATVMAFPGTESPGDPNYIPLTNVVISEVLAHSDFPFEDAIELHNPTASSVNISGWWLSDSARIPRKFQVPPNTTISPGGHVVFYESQFNNSDVASIPFALSSSRGDQVHLCETFAASLNGLRAIADFGPSENGVSMGRFETSQGVEFVALSRRTFGNDNPSTLQQFRGGGGLSNAYPKVGPIVMSEIMYHPANNSPVEEYIELHNTSASAVRLYDHAFPSNVWRFRDAVDFDFPAGTIVPPGGYLIVVSFDPSNNPAALSQFQSRYGTNATLVGPYLGRLDNNGDSVELYKPDAPEAPGGSSPYILVEKVAYSNFPPWPFEADGTGDALHRIGLGAYGNDPTNWIDALPALGAPALADSDGDGMPNSWEMLYSFNQNNAGDAAADADLDGISNLGEYIAGTHPRSANSRLRLDRIDGAATLAVLEFNAVAGKTYSIVYSDALSTGTWLRLIDIPPQQTTRNLTIYDSSVEPATPRFYRLRTP